MKKTKQGQDRKNLKLSLTTKVIINNKLFIE